jgi:hypothetical protein
VALLQQQSHGMLRAPDTCTAFGVLALDEDARRHGAKLAKAPTDHSISQ